MGCENWVMHFSVSASSYTHPELAKGSNPCCLKLHSSQEWHFRSLRQVPFTQRSNQPLEPYISYITCLFQFIFNSTGTNTLLKEHRMSCHRATDDMLDTTAEEILMNQIMATHGVGI